MRYIAENTSVPVPVIHAWNTDDSNAVGAEYMIMQKVYLNQRTAFLDSTGIEGEGMHCA